MNEKKLTSRRTSTTSVKSSTSSTSSSLSINNHRSRIEDATTNRQRLMAARRQYSLQRERVVDEDFEDNNNFIDITTLPPPSPAKPIHLPKLDDQHLLARQISSSHRRQTEPDSRIIITMNNKQQQQQKQQQQHNQLKSSSNSNRRILSFENDDVSALSTSPTTYLSNRFLQVHRNDLSDNTNYLVHQRSSESHDSSASYMSMSSAQSGVTIDRSSRGNNGSGSLDNPSVSSGGYETASTTSKGSKTRWQRAVKSVKDWKKSLHFKSSSSQQTESSDPPEYIDPVYLTLKCAASSVNNK